MRALLVNPSQFRAYGVQMPTPYPPLGLLSIGAVWRRLGVQVRYLDMDLDGPDGLDRLVREFRPDVLGVTATTPVFTDAEAVARRVRGIVPGVYPIIGGPHATAYPSDVLASGDFQAAVVGEGEETACEIIDRLDRGDRDLTGVRGTWFRRQGEVVSNPRRPLIRDLDSLPFPDRSLLPGLDAYSPPDAIRRPVATVMASRGCPGRCTFCCSPAAFGAVVRYRKVESVVEEIREAIEIHGAREIHFADDSLTEDKAWTLELCAGLRAAEFPVQYMFMNGLRVNRVDGEMLRALRSIGMENVGFGIESGSPRILEALRKGIDLEEARRNIQLAKSLGFATWCFFIIGSPGETDESAMETIDFAKRANPDFAKFFVFKPFPGTRAYRELAESGHLVNYERDLTGIYTRPVHVLDEMGPDRMMYWLRRANREFYLRPRKIADHARRIRSVTQLRYNLRSLRFVVGMMLRAA